MGAKLSVSLQTVTLSWGIWVLHSVTMHRFERFTTIRNRVHRQRSTLRWQAKDWGLRFPLLLVLHGSFFVVGRALCHDSL